MVQTGSSEPAGVAGSTVEALDHTHVLRMLYHEGVQYQRSMRKRSEDVL